MHSSVAYSMMQNLIPRFTCQCGFRRAASLKSSTPLILRIKRAKEFISSVFIRHHLKEGFFDSWKCHILIAGIISVFNGHAVLFRRMVEEARRRKHISGGKQGRTSRNRINRGKKIDVGLSAYRPPTN